MTFRIKWNRFKPWSPIITTDWQWLIRLAWGKRRVSSRAPAGTRAYPETVGASLKLWLGWIMAKRGYEAVVVQDTANDIHAMAAELRARWEREAQEAAAFLSDEDAAELERLRSEHRAARRFAEADAIRDRLIASGRAVGDARLA